MSNEIGLIGLGTMGAALALNFADHGVKVVAHEPLAKDDAGATAVEAIQYCASSSELVAALSRPRAVVLMVTAGAAVDAVIDELAPLLDAGDTIIDGGNSFFRDTERRQFIDHSIYRRASRYHQHHRAWP